jgi:hypothetical protein
MSARQAAAFTLKATERKALDSAREKYMLWKSDWHDDGAAADVVELAALRKAARNFHKALSSTLGPAGNNGSGTLGRLLCRMQEHHLYRRTQTDYYDDMTKAMFTALVIDGALGKDVQRGVKADRLVYTWVFHAANEWPGDPPTSSNRFGQALLNYQPRAVPHIGSTTVVDAALKLWRCGR